MDEATRILGEAQSVQQVLAFIIGGLLVVVCTLAKLLWEEIKANRTKVEDLYKEQARTMNRWAKALEDKPDEVE